MPIPLILRPLTSRLPDEQQPFGLYTSGKSVRRIYSKLEAEASRILGRAAELANKSDSPEYALDAAAIARMRAVGLPQAELENGLRAGVRMYVSSVEIRGNMLVADGFDNQVVVLRMGEDADDDDDHNHDDDDDDDDDNDDDEGDDNDNDNDEGDDDDDEGGVDDDDNDDDDDGNDEGEE